MVEICLCVICKRFFPFLHCCRSGRGLTACSAFANGRFFFFMLITILLPVYLHFTPRPVSIVSHTKQKSLHSNDMPFAYVLISNRCEDSQFVGCESSPLILVTCIRLFFQLYLLHLMHFYVLCSQRSLTILRYAVFMPV